MSSIILIAASNKDVASLNISRAILSQHPSQLISESFQGNPAYETQINAVKVRLVYLNTESIYAQNLTEFFTDLSLVIFVSRHSSESETPTLSVHTPGNLNKAELGGIDRRVSISPANAMRHVLNVMVQLRDELKLDYEVSYEATHHGPSLDVPTMFAELGSSMKQWNDIKAAEVVARATIEAVSTFGDCSAKSVLGIGGPHYNAKFTRIALDDEVAFGHIIPKYAIGAVNVDMLKQCVERTLEKVDRAVLDWKGIKGEDKPRITGMLNELGVPFEKV